MLKRSLEDVVKLKEDSSFEILPVSDEDEYDTSSMYSSTLTDSQYETISKSTFSEDDETTVKSLERNLEIFANHIFSASLEHSTPRLYLQMQSLQNSEFTANKNLEVEEISEDFSGDIISSNVEEETDFFTVINPAIAGRVEKNNYQIFKTPDEILRQYQKAEKAETCSRKESFSVDATNGNEDILVSNCAYDSGTKKAFNSGCPITLKDAETNINKCPSRSQKNSVVQLYPGRIMCPLSLCSVLKHSLKLCRWLRCNKYLQNLVAGAKSSFHGFLGAFEMEMNSMLGMENPLQIIIIADMIDSAAIKEAFLESFGGQVVISSCSEIEDSTIPALPVGYASALQAVQTKINIARQQHESECNAVMLSATTFVVENVPQRWQMSTALCLDDPNLQLNLHNFSVTIPVPNEYICQVQRLTPEDYPLKERGFAASLQEATGCVTGTDSKDMQELLTDVKHFVTLKSAARVLVGMYSKYAIRLD